MKKINQILAVFIALVSMTAYSQDARPITELLVELSKNHMGSVTDVFTLDEIQIIKEHFAETTFPEKPRSAILNDRYASTQSVSTVDAVDIDPSNISVIEVLRGSPITEFAGAGVYVRGTINPPREPRLIIVDDDGHLWERQPGQAPITITDMGEITGIPSGYSITGLEVLTGANAAIYGMATNGNNSILVTLSLDDLIVTPVGTNNGLVLPISLARDGNNDLYSIDIDDDVLYKIDKTTGGATQVGELGADFNFGQGMFFDEATGHIISLSYNTALGDSEMYSIDPQSGLATSMGTIQPGTIQQFGWGSYYDRDALGLEASNIDGFSMYPNPAQNTINLTATNLIETIKVYSILGTLVKKQNIGKSTIQINISELAIGAYILRVSTEKQSGIYKLIKK